MGEGVGTLLEEQLVRGCIFEEKRGSDEGPVTERRVFNKT